MLNIIHTHEHQSNVDELNNESKKKHVYENSIMETLTPPSLFPRECTFNAHDISSIETSTPIFRFPSEGSSNGTAIFSFDTLTRDDIRPTIVQRSTLPKGAPKCPLSTSTLLASFTLRAVF